MSTKRVEMKSYNLLGASLRYIGFLTAPGSNATFNGPVHDEGPTWIEIVMHDLHFLSVSLVISNYWNEELRDIVSFFSNISDTDGCDVEKMEDFNSQLLLHNKHL